MSHNPLDVTNPSERKETDPSITKGPSWQRDQFEAIARSGTKGAARQALLSAVNWADPKTGQLWPSVDNWAGVAGLSPRGLQKAIRRLQVAEKIKALTNGKGGARNTTKWEVPLLAVRKDEPGSPLSTTETPNAITEGANKRREKGEHGDAEPRTAFTRRNREEPNQEPATTSPDVGVLLSLGLQKDLLRHVNATPERLAWIARVAPAKKSPAGWAAQAIREGWNSPAVPMGGTGGVRKAAQARATVAGLTDEQRAELLARVRQTMPNLRGVPDDDAAVVGAMARIANSAAAAHRRGDERGQR
jgi:hypothetical protein